MFGSFSCLATRKIDILASAEEHSPLTTTVWLMEGLTCQEAPEQKVPSSRVRMPKLTTLGFLHQCLGFASRHGVWLQTSQFLRLAHCAQGTSKSGQLALSAHHLDSHPFNWLGWEHSMAPKHVSSQTPFTPTEKSLPLGRIQFRPVADLPRYCALSDALKRFVLFGDELWGQLRPCKQKMQIRCDWVACVRKNKSSAWSPAQCL